MNWFKEHAHSRIPLPLLGIGALVLALLPQLVPTTYVDVTSLTLIYLLMALGMNVMYGWTGLLNMGYIALAGVGAYGFALMSLHSGLGFVPSLVVATLATVALSLIVGLVTFRLRGDYYLVVTLASAQLLLLVVGNLTVTGRNNGLYGVDPPTLFGKVYISTIDFYYLAFYFALAGYLLSIALRNSALMQSWVYLKSNEFAAEVIGTHTVRSRFVSIIVGSAYAGVAGALLAAKLSTASPSSFGFQQMVIIFLAVIVGGTGGLVALLLGVFLVQFLPNAVTVGPQYQLVVFGAVLILVVLIRPQGILPVRLGLKPVRAQVLKARRAPAAEQPSPVERETVSQLRPRKKILELREVTVRFGGVTALNAFSLDLSEGQVIGLIGPNGSGKSTAFNAVTGVAPVRSGSIKWEGVDLLGKKPHEISRLGLSRTFQDSRLYDDLTVLDNVRSGIGDDGSFLRALRPVRERKRMVDQLGMSIEALHKISPDLVELYGDRPAIELPFAQRRLVEVARAAVSAPRLLLLDEPAAGLDSEERQLMVQLIHKIRDGGTTVWLVEHDMALMGAVADELIAMVAGAVVARGEPDEVTTHPQVLSAYLGETA